MQWLLLLRSVVGFALGGAPIAVTLFAELCTSETRGKWLLVMQGAWTVGRRLQGHLVCVISCSTSAGVHGSNRHSGSNCFATQH